MNYDEQQQQFYMQQQRMQNPQRMNVPLTQQHSQPNMQQQQQAIRQQPQTHYGMMNPHQQQSVMVRLPNQQMGEDPTGHYQQQQQQQAQLRDLIQSLPPEMQSQINSERDPARKKVLFQMAMKHQYEQHQQMGMRMMGMQPQRMQMPQPGGMAYSGQQMIIPQQQQQQSGAAQIQRIPSQGSFGHSPAAQNVQQQQPVMQMYPMPSQPQMQMGGPVRPAMQPMPVNQPFIQQQQQQSQPFPQQPHPQQISIHPTHQQPIVNSAKLPSSSTNNSALPQHQQKTMAIAGMQMEMPSAGPNLIKKTPGIPSQVHQLQSAGNTKVTLAEVAVVGAENSRAQNTPDASSLSAANTLTANSNQLLSESENPEYKTLLERLRTYHADVKRLLDRLNLDYPGEMKLKSSLINVIQVMEGTRKGGPVNRELLRKLITNVQTVLEQYKITRHLLMASRKLASVPAATRDAAIAKEQLFSDPWKEVRHLQIRIPAPVLETKKAIKHENNVDKTVKEQEVLDEEPSIKRSLITTLAESFSAPKKIPVQGKPDPANSFKVRCMDDSDLTLNSALSAALNEAIGCGFSIAFDEDRAPISSNSSTVQARLVYRPKSMGPQGRPLDLLLPTDYPKLPVQVLLTTWETTSVGSALENLLERIDSGFVDTYALKDLLEAWVDCLLKLN